MSTGSYESHKKTAADRRANSQIGIVSGALEERVRTVITESEWDGFMYLKVLSPLSSKQNMIARLKEYTGIEKVITIGSVKGEYDVYIDDGGGNATVKRIKKIYLNPD